MQYRTHGCKLDISVKSVSVDLVFEPDLCALSYRFPPLKDLAHEIFQRLTILLSIRGRMAFLLLVRCAASN